MSYDTYVVFSTLRYSNGSDYILSQNIDQVLRKTCENVIYQCTNLTCRALTPWLSSPVISSSTTPSSAPFATSSPGPSSSSSTPRLPPQQTEALFRESCTHEFRNILVKMRLYVDSPVGRGVDDGITSIGTIGVLVHHVRERVVEGYREFLDSVASQSQSSSRGEELGGEGGQFMGVVTLGKILGEVIDEVEAGG